MCVSFKLASNRYFMREGEQVGEVSFFNIEVWNRTAELCMKALAKGRGVRVVGRLKQDRWTDKDGHPQARVKIVCESIEFKTKFDKKPAEVQDES